jgi:hypothetical protein
LFIAQIQLNATLVIPENGADVGGQEQWGGQQD